MIGSRRMIFSFTKESVEIGHLVEEWSDQYVDENIWPIILQVKQTVYNYVIVNSMVSWCVNKTKKVVGEVTQMLKK